MIQEDQSVDHFLWDVHRLGRCVVDVLEGSLDGATDELTEVADEMFGGGRMKLFQETGNASNQRKSIKRILLFSAEEGTKVCIEFQLTGETEGRRERGGRGEAMVRIKETENEEREMGSVHLGNVCQEEEKQQLWQSFQRVRGHIDLVQRIIKSASFEKRSGFEEQWIACGRIRIWLLRIAIVIGDVVHESAIKSEKTLVKLESIQLAFEL
jgi:hypothetical protein